MDPFDILGIKPTRDINKIKIGYKKMLIATHPDKMGGDARCFMMVHTAFNELKGIYGKSEVSMPTNNVEYKEHKCTTSKNNKKMSGKEFNAFFQDNKISTLDPFNRGYSQQMSKSLTFQEDASQLKNASISNIPKRDVVIYREPKAAATGSWTDNCEPLGKDKIDDFTTNSATDYMKAYSHPEELVDTARRHQSVDDLKSERGSANFSKSKEDERYYKKLEQHKARVEAKQNKKYKQQQNLINDQYTKLHERLGWTACDLK
jgi:curved DNA-binding protein CbpA